MFLAFEQTIGSLVLLVAAAVWNAVPVFSDSASGNHSACAEIATAYAEWSANGGECLMCRIYKGVSSLTVPKGKDNFAGIAGQTGYDCLRSMPFRADLAVRFIDEYVGYLQFHSTIEVLKSPPPEYISTSLDLIGGLDLIRERIESQEYESHFDFDWDLNYLITRANDGHLTLGLCSQLIFHFEHGVPLVSISDDGIELPKLYTYSDVESKMNGAKDVSPVVEINGLDADYYLEANFAVFFDHQDPDARYNRLFPSTAAGFTGRYGGGSWTTNSGLWPGAASQTLQFANGTNLTVETTASWPPRNGHMVHSDGETLFKAACIPDLRSSFGSVSGSSHAVSTYSFPSGVTAGYPEPVLRHPHDLIRGYYLDETEAHDVAVLQVPTFRLGDEISDFVQTAVGFVKRAITEGKVKIIIDLSGNGGGDITQGFNLFRIFYPDQPVYSATRFRATELIDLMGLVYARSVNFNSSVVSEPPILFQKAVTPDQQDSFASWKDLYGPHEIFGANMSSLYATYNLSIASDKSDPISGYGKVQLDPSIRPFATENIILMTDGYCESTCSLFVELMKKQGVRTIVFGGRPVYGPMQAVGGVKGGQHLMLSQIHRYISNAHDLAVNASKAGSPILTPEQLARFEEIAPPSPKNFSLQFDAVGLSGVNFRNAYREGDDLTPLQFIYEAADCRLFYTAENYLRPATSWLAAANAMLNNGSCVEGSNNANDPESMAS